MSEHLLCAWPVLGTGHPAVTKTDHPPPPPALLELRQTDGHRAAMGQTGDWTPEEPPDPAQRFRDLS